MGVKKLNKRKSTVIPLRTEIIKRRQKLLAQQNDIEEAEIIESEKEPEITEPISQPVPDQQQEAPDSIAEPIIQEQQQIAEPITEPVIQEDQENNLLANFLKPTDKDGQFEKAVNDLREESADDIEEDEEETTEDEKVKVSPQQIRKEAHLKAVIYTNTGKIALDKICKLATGDWETNRYKVSDEELEMIRGPLKQLLIIQANDGKKKRSPKAALVTSVLVVVIPILLTAVIDGIKNYKSRKKKKEDEEKLAKEKERNDLLKFVRPDINQPIQQQQQPEQAENKTPEPKKINSIKGKPGRHAKSCPRNKNKTAICNCK